MTAEIAVLNKSAVALAADSAVTVQHPSGHKIFDTANKLFSLSKYHPVGILIYGNAELVDVPWETIIKEFRGRLGDRDHKYLEDYVDEFVDYLTDSERFFPKDQQKIHVLRVTGGLFSSMRDEIDERVRPLFSASAPVTEGDVQAVMKAVIAEHVDVLDEMPFLAGADQEFETKLGRTYASEIKAAREHVFDNYPLNSAISQRLNTAARRRICRAVGEGTAAGIVIAGFGAEDVYPKLREFKVDGIFAGTPLRVVGQQVDIRSGNAATIVPFAQQDMVHLFMSGITPDYADILSRTIREVFEGLPPLLADYASPESEQRREALETTLRDDLIRLADEIERHSQEYRRSQHSRPIVDAVAILPKDELAALAESLVNLTSFKRRFSMGQLETVGGAIDVALISKGDGFVWINRKHYFAPELNHQFFATYHQR